MPAGQGRIWDYFQNEAPESFAGSRARLEYLVRRIAAPQRVLNIGCGSGILEELAVAKGIEIYSLDPSERAIRRLRETLRIGDRARVGYIQELNFPAAHFDVVVVSEVFEHLTVEAMVVGLVENR